MLYVYQIFMFLPEQQQHATFYMLGFSKSGCRCICCCTCCCCCCCV